MKKVKVHEISKLDLEAKRYKLMVKVHWDTGINYLCITTKDNYLEYSGSGVRWKRLLKKHPSEIYTYLLYSSDKLDDFNNECIKMSSKLDVVNCEYFANLIPESGYGRDSFEPNHSEQGKLNIKNAAKLNGLKQVADKIGIHNPEYNELRNGWAKNGANALILSGNIKGCTTKEWMDENEDQQRINCSNGGKVGGIIVGNMFWWNNGTINKKSYECPDGFSRGMLMSDKKRKQVYEKLCKKSEEIL